MSNANTINVANVAALTKSAHAILAFAQRGASESNRHMLDLSIRHEALRAKASQEELRAAEFALSAEQLINLVRQ